MPKPRNYGLYEEAEGGELLHDTPSDAMFDDDPENPRSEQELDGPDKRDYDSFVQRRIDGINAARRSHFDAGHGHPDHTHPDEEGRDDE